MNQIIKNFWKDEEGATAIEYGLIAGLIAVALIGVMTTLGTDLGDLFKRVSTGLKAAVTSADKK
ncbi:Flp family type IVb pilin [Comamonas composti]|uniref:Flp family type IVb pilin n=1 Tax=Comamonas composti TaxID=408558 RepID=UPI00042726E9|nr:Flp family type IVb pilin [Comamonas composti]